MHAPAYGIGFLAAALLLMTASEVPLQTLAPAEVTDVRWCAGPDDGCLSWSPRIDAEYYRIYRGEDRSLRCLLTFENDSCSRLQVENDVTTGPGAIAENPASGRFFWFLVSAVNGSGEGPVGDATAGPRRRSDARICPAPCRESGSVCTSLWDCCSGTCTRGRCEPACCGFGGTACTDLIECCQGICGEGRCCSPPYGPCNDSLGCCVGPCEGGRCCIPDGGYAPNCQGCCTTCWMNTCGSSCKPAGSSCGSSLACCSGACMAGICQ